jgi:hypothetical protein
LVEEKSIFSTHAALSRHNYYFYERFYMLMMRFSIPNINTKYE